MKHISSKLTIVFFICFSMFSNTIFAQETIFDMMERTDIRLNEVEQFAKDYFAKSGTGKGTGYKQYQRWLYERKFHLDENGNYISPTQEFETFLEAAEAVQYNAPNTVGDGAEAVAGIWSELGPFNWTRTSGWNPGTGRLVSMAIHPSNLNVIYVGSPGGGLWKTANGGSTWTPLNDYNTNWMHIYSIAIDPLNQNIVYAGTGNSANQVIRSTDAGLTWSVLGAGPTGTIRKILIHPTTTNIVFACATNGIFRSTNSGTSWTQVNNTTKEDIEFKPGNPLIMYASGSTQVVRSVDNGVTWSVIGVSLGITNTGRTLVSVTPANPNYVYVVQANGSLFGRLYRSTNDGASFSTMVIGDPATNTNYFGYNTDGSGLTGQAGHDMAMCVSPTNANEVHIAGIICFKSTNGGTSFTASTAWSLPNSIGYNHADVHGLDFVNNTMFSLSDGGIYKSTDFSDNWTDLSSGLGIRQFYRIASSPTNGSVITGGAQDNGSVARQTGGNWVDWLGADGMEGLVSPTNHLNLWGTSQNGQLYRSSNGGNSRTTIASISGGGWVTPIAIHPTTETIIFAGGDAVYKSTNSGTSFTNISGTTISNTLVDLAVAPSNANYIYASYSNNLYTTTNGGTSWSTYTVSGSITDICVSPSNPLKIWVTTSSGTGRVYRSTNGGSSFTNITGSLPLISARSVVVDNSTNENLYVGMNIGVYTYSNSNPNWTIMTDNLPLVAINELDMQNSTNKLRVATYGRGVWETSLSAVTCAAPSNLIANSITLNSAILSWSAVTGASSYVLEYKLASASTWTVLTAATTTTSYTLTPLASGTSYDYRVKTTCSSGSSFYVQAQFTTLIPAPPCIASNEPNETLATAITIPAATVINAGISSATDIDYYKLTTTVNTDFTVSLSNLPFDYDVDIRNSAGTVLASGTNGGTNPELVVLNNQTPGTYYFRVSGYNGAFSGTQCYALEVNTLASPTCIAPLTLTSTAITSNTATLNWAVVASAISYTVEYRVIGSSTWLSANATTNTLTLTTLIANSGYEWQVRSNCSAGNSIMSTVATFTTLPSCPTGLPGTTMATAIVVGQAPCFTSPFIDTKTNTTANCFLNNYTGTNNQASPNVWYTFNLANPATVNVSHCGSTISDSYIHLLNQSGGYITGNDDNGPLCSGYSGSIVASLSAGTYYVVSEGYGTTTGSITTTIRRTDSCASILNLTLFLEGYYSSPSMLPVMLNQGYSGFPMPTPLDVDDIDVELRQSTSPYTIIATSTARLKTNGSASAIFPPLNGSYYIVIKHRNTLETWSAVPITIITGNNTYNFSTAATQAFGSNMKQVATGVWALYSGDVLDDDNIDLSDLGMIQIASDNFSAGYIPTDINGDGNVDLTDFPVVEANSLNFIFSVQP
jgi:hypothetical protein